MQRFLSHFKLRSKLLAGFAVLLGILFLASLLIRLRLIEVSGEINTVVSEQRPVAVVSAMLESRLDDMIAALSLYMSVRDEAYASDFRSKLADALNISNLLQGNDVVAGEPRYSELLESVGTDLEKLKDLGEQLIRLSSSDETTYPGLAYANKNLNPINRDILQLLSQMQQELPDDDNNHDMYRRISDLRYDWINVISGVRAYLAYHSDRVLHDVGIYFSAARENARDLASMVDGMQLEQADALRQLVSGMEQFEHRWQRLQGIHTSDGWRADSHLMKTRIAPLLKTVKTHLGEFTHEQNIVMNTVASQLMQDSRDMTYLVTVFMICGVVVSIVMSWGISRVVVTPIRQAADAMEGIASGDADLTKGLNVEGNDEVALLARSFNTFVEKARQSAEGELALSRLMRLSLNPTDIDDYLEETLELMTETVSWLGLLPKGGIFLNDTGNDGELRLAATRNFSPELLTLCATVPFGKCLCGRAAASGETVYSSCVDDRHDISFDGIQPHGHYSVPIRKGAAVLGVLVLYLPEGRAHSVKEVRFLERITEVISMGIILRRANADLMTAKQRTELANDKLTGITANIPGIIFQCRRDANGECVFPYVSQGTTTLLGTDKDNLEQDIQRLFSNVHPQDKDRLEKAFRYSSEQRKPINVEYRVNQEEAGTRWLLCNAVPRVHANGDILWDGLLLDITGRKMLEGQLLQAQKLESVGQLAAGIAHEINTPTQFVRDNARFLQDAFKDYQAVLSAFQRLREHLPDTPELAGLVAEVDRVLEEGDIEYLNDEIPQAIFQSLEGLQRIATIVSAMKEFSHPGTDAKQPLDINAVVRNIVTVSRNEWKYVAELETDLDETLPSLPGYRDKLGQVILNLIVNAAHAIGDSVTAGNIEKGCIGVQTVAVDGAVEIRVSDNGPGVPESIQQKIFDPFFTTKEVGKGTGQGLSIARSVIVDQHHGSLTLESIPGTGTTFVIRLPLDHDKAKGTIAA